MGINNVRCRQRKTQQPHYTTLLNKSVADGALARARDRVTTYVTTKPHDP